jgi:hypothetical protein
MSGPRAVATGSSRYLLKRNISRAKARAGIKGDAIPGLRSLRSLTRGYTLSPLRGWLTVSNDALNVSGRSSKPADAFVLRRGKN